MTFRSLRKNAGYTLVNLLGLTIGFTGVILIGLYIQNELSYDQYHAKKDQLFRMAYATEGASFENGSAKVSYPWGDAALENIPEVINRCRFTFFGRSLFRKDKLKNYESGGLYADASVFSMFDWKLLEGDPETALKAPNSIVLTQQLADKYFNKGNALGKTLTLDNDVDYSVTGIVEDVPTNSHFTFNFLVSMSSYSHPNLHTWNRWIQSYTYVELEKGTNPDLVVLKMDAILDQHLEAEAASNTKPIMQPLTSIHLHSKLHREMAANSDWSYLLIFGAIALFILIIASLNFINLSTARAADRAKEVGVRKVIGASRKLLIQQFLGESQLICILSAFMAVLLAEAMLPPLNAFLGSNLRLDLLGNPTFLTGLILVTLITGLLSGIYPSFILSSFRPISVIKGQLSFAKNAGLRKGLVIFQFALATFMIVASLVVSRQLDYIQNKNLGFNKDQIVVIPMQASDRSAQKTNTIKQELAQIPGVLGVAASGNRPGGSDWGIPYTSPGLSDENRPGMRCLMIDEAFLKTYGMELQSGRGFSTEFATDSAAYLINEEAARQLGWTDPLEHQLAMPAIGRAPGPVIGVVKDFHFRSMHEKIAPLFFFMQPSWHSQFSLKLEAQNINKTLAQVEQKWNSFEPNYPFTYSFFDQQFEALHREEETTAQMIKGFTILAIFVTCLGLFALSTYLAMQRKKEIGIRKVLGATTIGIIGMLSKDYLKLVLISFIVGAPIAWFFTSQWLENFAYSIQVDWKVFAIAILLAASFAFLTVSIQSIRAAYSNPVNSLRSD